MTERITEAQAMKWMRKKVKKDGFKTAADLARQFLETRDINQAHHPDFPVVIDASFKVAEEVYGPF